MSSDPGKETETKVLWPRLKVFWLHVTSLTTSVSTMTFLLEKNGHFKGDKIQF